MKKQDEATLDACGYMRVFVRMGVFGHKSVCFGCRMSFW